MSWESPLGSDQLPKTFSALSLSVLAALSLSAQETPAPNRVAWLAIFPEPLPDGEARLSLEATSQFLRPSSERSADGRTFVRLDGEEWQITGDLSRRLGPGRVNLRLRVVDRSGGIADSVIQDMHHSFGMRNGGREDVPDGCLAYHLERDGVVVADLDEPGLHLMDSDLAYVFSFGNPVSGARIGASVQMPTGDRHDFSGSGGWDGLLGVSGWISFGSWRFHGQGERIFIDLAGRGAYRTVLGRQAFSRAWVGAGWQGDGPGFWRGFGLDVTFAYNESPYRVGISRLDAAGLQQNWVLTHRTLPRWRFGVSEEAGSYAAPDVTAFVSRSF